MATKTKTKTKPAPTLVSEHGQGGGYTAPKKAPPKPAPAKVTPTVITPPTAPIDPTPGYTPDYGTLIKGDPLYQQNLVDLSAQGISSAADRKTATDRALIGFGDVGDLTGSINSLGLDPNSPMFKMLFGDVDPTTVAAAKGNTYSTTAGLDLAHQQSLDSIMNSLAARGAVRSGAAGVAVGNENTNYGNAQFSARQNLLDYLTGVQSAFNTSESARQAAATSAANDATTRQIAEHPYVAPTPGTPSVPGLDSSGNPIPYGSNPSSIVSSLVPKLNIPTFDPSKITPKPGSNLNVGRGFQGGS